MQLNLNQAPNPQNGPLSKKNDIDNILEDLRRQDRIYKSLSLSRTLEQSWRKDQIFSQATIKQAPFYVISKTTMPAVLIEIGFLTNPKEVKKLSQNKHQDLIAEKIYSAILSFKEKVDNPEAKTLN
jgi:N-acetylmuramoyl-L-alanine amidase